jgi:hypothetical protein
LLSRERDYLRNVCCVLGADDESWATVEAAVEDGARLLVAGVLWRDHPTVENGAELRYRDGGTGLWRI